MSAPNNRLKVVNDSHTAAPGQQLPGLTIGNAVTIASGKGGVGKTWLAISLAQALARSGGQVLLFDGDIGLANVDIQLGLTPAIDLGSALERQLPLQRAITSSAATGFDVIAGRSGSGNLASLPAHRLAALGQGLQTVARSYNHVIADLGAGVDRPVRYFAGLSDLCLVVANDEPTSLTDAYALIKLLIKDNATCRIGIVINSAASQILGQRTYETLAKACDSFLKLVPPLFGIIRRDAKVKEAIRAQIPLLTRSPTSIAAADVEALARRLATGS